MLCRVRNARASVSRSVGLVSSATRSSSSFCRFSFVSIRKSLRTSLFIYLSLADVSRRLLRRAVFPNRPSEWAVWESRPTEEPPPFRLSKQLIHNAPHHFRWECLVAHRGHAQFA